MRSIILLFGLFFCFQSFSLAQTEKVEWDGKVEKIDDNTFKVILTAEVEEGWYIYSQYMEQGGPLPTEIVYEGDNFELKGKTEETGEKTKEMFDEVFEIDVKKFGEKAVFTQVIKTKGKAPSLTAFITFMSCNDERCNPPRQIEIELKQ